MASYPNGIPISVKRRRYTLKIGVGFYIGDTIPRRGEWLIITRHPLASSPEEAFYLARQQVLKQFGRNVDPNAIWLYADQTKYQEVK